MNQDSSEYPEYREYAPQSPPVDYADPRYYRQDSAHPVPAEEPVSSYPIVPPPEQLQDEYIQHPGYIEYSDGRAQGNPYLSGQQQQYYTPYYGGAEGHPPVAPGMQPYQERSAGKLEGKQKKRGLAGLGGSLTALLAFVFKFKFGWLAISAALSVAAYALIFPWQFALGMVIMLFIHEMGHAIVMKIKGIPIGRMIFIPLFGAMVTMQRMPQNARDEAEVGIAGPLAGSLAASFCLFMAQASPQDPRLWGLLAYFGFFINLFNLIPVVPFDGGRVLGAIDRRVWILGFVALLGFQIWEWLNGGFSIWLLFFVVMAASQVFSRGVNINDPATREYYNVPVATRIVLSLLYFGLIAVLVMGMNMTHGLLGVTQ